PIIRFHSRYNELNKTDFKYMFNKAYYPLKGFVPSSGVKPYKNANEYLNNKKKVQSIPTKNIKYLNKIKGLCNEKNTELILIEMPSTDTWTHKRHKSVQEYADRNNLTFIDFNYLLDKVGINWNTDTKDKGNHLNTLGAMKITKYMGEYIKNNLNVTDHRNEPEYNMWNKDYVEYSKLRDESLNEIYKKINK
ncbi:MAG: hypothetical protein PUD59_02075, partial [bacterium]|nr:hypothetical protein [bacterium]